MLASVTSILDKKVSTDPRGREITTTPELARKIGNP